MTKDCMDAMMWISGHLCKMLINLICSKLIDAVQVPSFIVASSS